MHSSGARAVLGAEPIKAPPWHGWVLADLLLNSLASGTFAIAALCDLIAPATCRPVARVGYLIAFPLVIADLVCLIFDLGHPTRFHHMLRVFKPRSPMSLGVWSTSVFAALAFAAWLIAITNSSAALARTLIVVLGLIAALVVGTYKGVLFSITAQPGWKDARWLGAALSASSGALGAATLLAVAALFDAPSAATLRSLLEVLIVLDFVATLAAANELRATAALRLGRGLSIAYDSIALGIGLLVPLLVLLASDAPPAAIAASILVLPGALGFRHLLVTLPHR